MCRTEYEKKLHIGLANNWISLGSVITWSIIVLQFTNLKNVTYCEFEGVMNPGFAYMKRKQEVRNLYFGALGILKRLIHHELVKHNGQMC